MCVKFRVGLYVWFHILTLGHNWIAPKFLGVHTNMF